ncbi:PREDICTED: proline-rich receptor-like protein kinase PERK8 [Tarenaya hassleriana]|uniref:proline-rich receptor-like protein kinase PERK8 n=1 Tax=Tarenaya hassleriana TaxID=28532 RepID=UPI00053C6062|nr:PREDICTED: proline-rich receptor-like protein kinase PERK8 [Tarenaya hassleriana]
MPSRLRSSSAPPSPGILGSRPLSHETPPSSVVFSMSPPPPPSKTGRNSPPHPPSASASQLDPPKSGRNPPPPPSDSVSHPNPSTSSRNSPPPPVPAVSLSSRRDQASYEVAFPPLYSPGGGRSSSHPTVPRAGTVSPAPLPTSAARVGTTAPLGEVEAGVASELHTPSGPKSVNTTLPFAAVTGEVPLQPGKPAVHGTLPQATLPSVGSDTWSKRVSGPPKSLQRIGTPSTHKSGIPLVHIPVESLEASVDEWSDFVVGQFYGLPPSMGRIVSVSNGIWSRNSPKIKIQDVGNGTFLFKMPNRRIRDLALSKRFWHLFSTDSLSRIVTTVGNPLYLDRQTSAKENVTVARIFIDVNLRCQPPRNIMVTLPDGQEHLIDISYDWLPPRCEQCSELGHDESHCPTDSP